MIRIKSFSIAESDEANKFMETHTPTISQAPGGGVQRGIQINMGYIIIFYEDGEFSYQSLYDKTRAAIVNAKENVEIRREEIVNNTNALEALAPAGYKPNMPDKDIMELCKKEGATEQQAKDTISAIAELENKNLMAAATIKKWLDEIAQAEKFAKQYKKLIK
jgi:hypothetical protein